VGGGLVLSETSQRLESVLIIAAVLCVGFEEFDLEETKRGKGFGVIFKASKNNVLKDPQR